MKGKLVGTIGDTAFTDQQLALIRHCIGRLQDRDHGKQVFEVADGVYQVENGDQRDERVARESMQPIPLRNVGYEIVESQRVDYYLSLVRGVTIKGPEKHVTWIFNHQSGGFCWGHYFQNRVAAKEDYSERLALQIYDGHKRY